MGEFPTAWHRERYISDLEREVEGAKKRFAELKELDVVGHVLDAAKDAVKNAETELDRARNTPKVKDNGGEVKQPADGGENPAGEKTIDEMTGKELDAFAAELKIEGWKPSAKVPEKKTAIHAFVAAKLTEAAEQAAAVRAELDALDDEALRAKAAELSLEVAADADHKELVDAVFAALGTNAGDGKTKQD